MRFFYSPKILQCASKWNLLKSWLNIDDSGEYIEHAEEWNKRLKHFTDAFTHKKNKSKTWNTELENWTFESEKWKTMQKIKKKFSWKKLLNWKMKIEYENLTWNEILNNTFAVK